jgi:hypothetical protein
MIEDYYQDTSKIFKNEFMKLTALIVEIKVELGSRMHSIESEIALMKSDMILIQCAL